MPITKSAKKSLKVSEKKREINKIQERALEKALKGVNEKTSNEVISKIDKAAKTHLISKNKAARLKSRIAKKFGTPKSKKKTVVGKPKTVKKTEKKKSAQKKS